MRLDERAYEAIATTPTPNVDGALRHLSRAANKSVLWAVIAGFLALSLGEQGRRAAVRGMAAVGLNSLLCNLVAKPISKRRRPQRTRRQITAARHVHMPGSSSFPSGHAASAFAFAAAISTEMPELAFPTHALAALVAYSRVHTGVHYPSDVVAGAVFGASISPVAIRLVDRVLAAPPDGVVVPLGVTA